MKFRNLTFKTVVATAVVLCAAVSVYADKKKDQLVKPMAGPRATALRVTWLYITPDKQAQKVDRVQVGREMVVAEKSGPWIRAYANTDIEEEHTSDQPVFGASEPGMPTPPVAPTSSATTTTREALPRLTFHAVRMSGRIAGAIITRNSFIRVGRKLNTISIRSLDIPRRAPST